jgi:DNA-binding NtrC family response regulator
MRRETGQINVLLEPVMLSAPMRRLDAVLRMVADKDVVVCLIGESGTGKEVFARRLHELSPRRGLPFVPINCAAIPETLFESELFGHERGAFTGASHLARGKIESAEEGTLFLDEIGELPLSMQVKLLRFLENRRFMRVGGSKKIESNARVVCATLRPLEDDVARGLFRADLYYRIQGITLAIPPLRERRADIGPLMAQFVAQLSVKHRVASPRFTRAASAALVAYDWPGNVRELRNVVERLCVLRGGAAVNVVDLPAAIQRRAGSKSPDGARDRARPTIEIPLDQSLDHTIDEVIRAAVALEGGNRTRAAERLQIGLRTVQRRLSAERTS